VLLLDGVDGGRALPWSAVQKKLAPQALVVSLSPFDTGLAREAQLRIPSQAPLEGLDEVLPGIDSNRASYALATPAPLTRRSVDTIAPVELLQRVARARSASLGSEATYEGLLRQRVSAIVAARRGRFLARNEQELAETSIQSPDDGWKVLTAGGCWIDDEVAPGTLRVSTPLPGREALERWKRSSADARTLTLVPFAARGSVGAVPLSPIMTKLYQESALRPAPGIASIHPETASVLGVRAGRRVRIESAAGSVEAELRLDATLPKGRLALAAGPIQSDLHPTTRTRAAGALALAVVDANGVWRDTRVTLREV
jgi:hypothetical protein